MNIIYNIENFKYVHIIKQMILYFKVNSFIPGFNHAQEIFYNVYVFMFFHHSHTSLFDVPTTFSTFLMLFHSPGLRSSSIHKIFFNYHILILIHIHSMYQPGSHIFLRIENDFDDDLGFHRFSYEIINSPSILPQLRHNIECDADERNTFLV